MEALQPGDVPRPMRGSELFAMRCAKVGSASTIAVKGPDPGQTRALASGLAPAPAPVHVAATRHAPLIGLSPVEPAPSSSPQREPIDLDSRKNLSGLVRIGHGFERSSLDNSVLERVAQRPSYALSLIHI